MARTSRQGEKAISGVAKREAQIQWSIAGYIRLSREDGNEESESVVNQKKILFQYLASTFEGQYTINDFYVDDGLSGTDDSRESFMRMTQDIEAGKVNCVLCKSLSRAFRNYSDQGYYLEYYFPQKKVRFISTGDPKIDTYTNPEAITGLEVPITGLMNDRFAAKTSSEIRRTFDAKRRNGEFIGAFAPYGYMKDPKDKNRLLLDEEVVPIKRNILLWFIRDGMSLAGIAKRLNELGVLNPTAYKRSQGHAYCNPNMEINDGLWVSSTVRRILTDQMNLGHMVQGKQRVVSYKVHDRVATTPNEWFIKENTHELTFTQEEYDKAQRLLLRDTRTPEGGRKIYLFGGFLKCADCKKALRRNPVKGIVYYNCRTYVEKSKQKCTKHSIREEKLISLVLTAIQKQITLLDGLSDIAEQVNLSARIDTGNKRIEKMMQEKHREKDRIRTLKDGLYEDLKAGVLDSEDYFHMKAKYDEQARQVADVIENLESELRHSEKEADSENNALTLFLKHKNIQQLDRALLVELVDTIYVHEGQDISLEFRFTDEPERLMAFAKQK
ncbi:MAG: recombinase family protein [Oscillospiraceae bacterium]|nr:recombinase family protein [Oscillospiraceae bacterium]